MIYLDNAATTFPKPREVARAMARCMSEFAGNPGRSSHPVSAAAARAVYDTRCAVAEMFGAESEENVVFTKNATEALCLAIFGLIGRGDHVITTNFEHNSVRRPLCRLRDEKGVGVTYLDARQGDDALVAALDASINPNTRALVCLHSSNVCTRVLPVRRLGEVCQRRGVLFILDAAQSAGIYDINIKKDNVDVLCAPGHKGLFGPTGTGFCVFRDGFDFSRLSPLLFGGTGVDSISRDVGRTPPESYEAGTLNVPGIAGLGAGIGFNRRRGTAAIREHEAALCRIAKDELLSLGATVYGDYGDGAVVLFNLRGKSGSQVAEALGDAGICVRAGMHCAPTAHDALGTGGDAVRVSFSPMNTERDVRGFIDAVNKLR